jgi:hypothetical protein
MDCSPNRCSYRRRGATSIARAGLLLGILIGCNGCGHAGERSAAADSTAAAPTPAAAEKLLCVPSNEGFLRARLQGAIEAELDWSSAGVPQCRGGLRPSGDGVRLLFKGPGASSDQPLLIVIGIGPLRPGESRRQVPVNLTVVREGAGEFYATQGDDKCAMDDVRQQPVPGQPYFRLTARGYCTQPARAVRGDGAVLVPTFDVAAVVDYAEAAPAPTLVRAQP